MESAMRPRCVAFAFASFVSMGLLLAAPASATTISYPDFSDVTGLNLNPNAQVVDDKLRLTTGLRDSGSAFSETVVQLGNDASFSTRFSFQITNPVGRIDGDGVRGADGIVFVLQSVANTVGAQGAGIGYEGIASSLGVEIDTWDNGPQTQGRCVLGCGGADIDGNHVGINLQGDLDNPVTQVSVATPLNNGEIWHMWVDYNGLTDLLEVRLSETPIRPLDAITSATIDLVAEIGGTEAFIGFTSGTGGSGNDHDILGWEFRTEFEPLGDNVPVPTPGAAVLFLAGLWALRRRA